MLLEHSLAQFNDEVRRSAPIIIISYTDIQIAEIRRERVTVYQQRMLIKHQSQIPDIFGMITKHLYFLVTLKRPIQTFIRLINDSLSDLLQRIVDESLHIYNEA